MSQPPATEGGVFVDPQGSFGCLVGLFSSLHMRSLQTSQAPQTHTHTQRVAFWLVVVLSLGFFIGLFYSLDKRSLHVTGTSNAHTHTHTHKQKTHTHKYTQTHIHTDWTEICSLIQGVSFADV